MQEFHQSEPTTAKRRFYVALFDIADGQTPQSGEAGGQPMISVNCGSLANTVNTLVAIDDTYGLYYVELAVSELATLGTFCIVYTSANVVQFQMTGNVKAGSTSVSLDAVNNAIRSISQRVNWIEYFLKSADSKGRQQSEWSMI